MKNGLFRKGFVLGIILLFVGAGIIPSTVGIIKVKKSFTGSNSPGYIQDLIDNASDGDTIYIPSGTYYENIVIDKSINLLGENRNTTVINGSEVGDVVLIDADWVNISGFTIRNSYLNPWAGTGIVIRSDYNTITGNIISNNQFGIRLWFSSNNVISDNTITSDVWNGIGLWFSSNNNITGNIISNNLFGIKLRQSNCNTITGNDIKSNKENGIWLEDACNNNSIYHNNFIGNGQNAEDECDNFWDDGEYGNYWSDYEEKYPFARKIWSKGIWNTPYEIEGGDNKDNCPLINQWPKSKSKAITGNTASNSYYWLRFLERFPILRQLLGL